MTVVNQRLLMRRINILVSDGYLLRGSMPNTIMLTPKGLNVLFADSDRPIDKSELKKESLEFERENARKKAEGQ